MSTLYSLICAAIAVVAVIRLNSIGHESSYLRRSVLVMLGAGGFGTAVGQFEPGVAGGWSEILLVTGVLVSMIARYYRPEWYADRDRPCSRLQRRMRQL